jgi:superfamily II DNA or RNA helicase
MTVAIRKQDIRSACGDRAYARGVDYQRNGHVVDIQTIPSLDGLIIRSSVSGGSLYRQEITVFDFDDVVEIEGSCSCPVGYNCKHVAAVLYALQQSPDTPSARQRQVDKWLAQLHGARQPRQWLPNLGDTALLYVVSMLPAKASQATVRLQLARVLKNGKGYGKGRPVFVYERHSRQVQAATQPIDVVILNLMAGMSGYSDAILQGQVGYLLLTMAVETGRAHWGSADNPPLRQGADRELRMSWRNDNDTVRLTLATEPAGGLPIMVDPPLYIDPAGMAVGPLTIDDSLDPRTLEALAEAPALSVAMADTVADRLLQEFPDLAIPLPAQRNVRELRDQAPTTVLRLTGDRGVQGDRLVQLATLEFDYAGQRVGLPLEGTTSITDAEGLVRIHRAADVESRAWDRLRDFGFSLWPDSAPTAPQLHLDTRPASENARRWRAFIDEVIPQLVAEGWLIEQSDAFTLRFSSADTMLVDIEDAGSWFDMGIGVDVDGRRIDLIPLLAELASRFERPDQLPDTETLLVETAEAQWLELPTRRIKPLLTTLFDLFDRADNRQAALRLARADAARLQALDDSVIWRGGEAIRELAQRLNNHEGIAPIELPDTLQAELRPYQQQGVSWLQLMRESGFGALLADDMGLGKTLQTLAHLLVEQQAGRLDRPALVVAPTSLMANWRYEASRFTPTLRVLTLQGPDRKAHFDAIVDHDLVLTTYPLLPRDEHVLRAHAYHCVILDEAQTIKNPQARAAKIVRQLETRHRLCLTGTPMENHLGELWSLFHFLNPGYLGDRQTFRRLFRVPIEEHGDGERQQLLQRRVAPFLLRRSKQAVAGELPDKVEILRTVAFDNAQASLYESVRAAMDQRVRDALRHKGLARSHVTILDALLKLRQICCDPRLVRLDHAHGVQESAKLNLLMQMLPEMIEEGRRILLFSQFTSMLKLIESALQPLGIAYAKLTGQTRKREAVIDRFRSGEVPLFLISLKAGGVGLNLTEADTVIHYDPWWNPAVEHQATDRAHRIGQTNKVFVYKLVAEQTVEQKILALQAKKSKLAAGLYRSGRDEAVLTFSEEDLRTLLEPLDSRAGA